MKRYLNIIAWLAAGAYLVLVLGFVENEYEDVPCTGLQVWIRDSLETRFVGPEKVKEKVMQIYPGLKGMAMSEINTGQLEEVILDENTIRNAQVYTTVEGLLVVEILQRKPVIRVQDRDHQDFYLDGEGTVIIPERANPPRILLANGDIDGKYRKMENVLSGRDSENSENIMEDLVHLATLIDNDPFWRSQIVQVYVNHQSEFELIPRVGSHIILFGTGEKMEDKFFRLRTLYEEGFSREGWNQYEFINLKYDKQVICTKR